MNRRNIFLWTLYDFANSIPVAVFFLYFSQWLVIDNKVADIWWNLIFTGSTILLVLTAPIFGRIADQSNRRMPFLTITTALMAICLLLTSLLAGFTNVTSTIVIWAAGFFLLANYFYQFSLCFYNSLLVGLAPLRIRGLISGFGHTAGWIGWIVGILITLPIATGAINFLGNPGRSQTFLPAVLIFILLVLPVLLLFKEKTKPAKFVINLSNEYKNSFNHLKILLKTRGVGRFLLGYFFFNDAVLTASNNFPIYMEQVFKISDTVKSMLLVGILITSAIGAAITGWIADKFGLKRVLLFILMATIVIFPVVAIQTNFTIFTITTILFGFLYGAVWTVARAVMSYLTPEDKLSHGFSYYSLAERFSTLVGPISWGLITLLLVHTGELRYRIAMISMAAFVLIGLLIVRSIPAKPHTS